MPTRPADARVARPWGLDVPAVAVTGGYAAGDRGLVAATSGLLASLRVLLSLSSTSASSGAGGGSTGGGAGGGGGFAPGTEPKDFERVSALVELAQRGDSEAFGMLYERYVDVVYRYVYVRVGSVALAEDLTSETFLRALRRMDSFSWQGRDIAAWFITIARNLITDNAKSARFRLEVTTGEMLDPDTADAPEQEVLQRLRDTRLLEAVKGLKPEQQECVVLRFLQGLSLAETAKVLGKTEGAVKQLQLRAVRSLHRELADVDL
ncbi:MAG TPA: sigma-70 family RNA polymerase sigma factor [Pedococcus sp.]|jgi:RNA polymerase sigma-70 factor (ECF subfamily)